MRSKKCTSAHTEEVIAWGSRFSSNDYDDPQGSFKVISKRRSCTNFLCLLVFAIFIGCWLSIGYYAYWNGSLKKWTAPTNSLGQICGEDDEVKDAPNLLFFDITQCVSWSVLIFGCSTKQICVSKCPDTNWFSEEEIFGLGKGERIDWAVIQKKLICDNATTPMSVNSIEKLLRVIEEEECAPYYVKSTPAFGVCLPSPSWGKTKKQVAEDLKVQTQEAQDHLYATYEFMAAVRKDLKKCWHLVILFICAATMSSLFTILVMGIITKIFVWIILWLLVLLLLYSTVITFTQYEKMPSSPARPVRNRTSTPSSIFPSGSLYGKARWMFQQKETWLVLFIISASSFVVLSLLILFLRSRIDIAVVLIGEGSKAVNMIKSTLVFPLITRALQVSIIIWFILIFMYVRSMGPNVYRVKGLEGDKDCHCKIYQENDWCVPDQFREYCKNVAKGEMCAQAACQPMEERNPKMSTYLLMFNFFGLLWGLFFVSGLNRMILSHSFASWYWTFNKHDLPFFVVTKSIFVVIRYHLGTIALGSFLIASCGFIRAILERLHKMFKNAESTLAECAMWTLRCCFWILEKFLVFVSINAYIMCAITGEGFFNSASEAFGLITRNIARVIVLDKVLDFLMFVGKLTVTFIMAFFSYFSFAASSMGLTYPLVPTIIVAVSTWIISSAFYGVYSIAVDTLFLSFLKDGEINDGSKKKPYYMSHKLKYMLKDKASKR